MVCHIIQVVASRLELGVGIGNVSLNLPSNDPAIPTCPKERIGCPNAVRTPAYSFITWTHRFAIPFPQPFLRLLRHSAQPASLVRSPDCASTWDDSDNDTMQSTALPSSPMSRSSGTSTLSNTSSAVPEARIPSLCLIGWPMENPGMP